MSLKYKKEFSCFIDGNFECQISTGGSVMEGDTQELVFKVPNQYWGHFPSSHTKCAFKDVTNIDRQRKIKAENAS